MNASNRTITASALKEKAIEEFRTFLVLFLYLWALFGLFVLQEGIVLRSHGLGFSAQGFAVINALVLAKVMLIVENLDLSRWLRGKPLIISILYDSLVLTFLFLCFHLIEHITVGLFRREGLVESLPTIGGGGWMGLLSVVAILYVALIPYFAFKNLGRALGPGRLEALLFKGSSNEEVG